MGTRRTDVAVMVVGMNTRKFVKGFLDSLALTEWNGYTHEVIYVDNASTDDTVAMLRRDFPYVRVIVNPTNVGFTKAANQAAQAANSRYHLQINNDTIAYPDSIPQLVDFLEANPEAAAVGGRILNPDLTDQWSARRFPRGVHALFGRRSKLATWFQNSRVVKEYLYKDEILGTRPFRVEWVPTVYMLVREEAYFAMGGMPEDLYYWAEAVFCDRLRKAGKQVWVVPTSKIVHFEGHGGGPRPRHVRRWHIIDFHRGAYRFYLEHSSPSVWNPGHWLTAGLLATRAALLLTKNRLSTEGDL